MALARSVLRPGPDTPPGPPVPAWPGEALPLPPADQDRLDLDSLLRLSLAASPTSGRLRPNPSAGGRHPVDVILDVGARCTLPPGRYGYDPLRHRVHRLSATVAPALGTAGATVALSVTMQRTRSHYGHRAGPLALLDTGHAAGALYAAALSLGLPEPRLDLTGTRPEPLATVTLRPAVHRATGDTTAQRSLTARRSADPALLTGTPPPAALAAVLAAANRHGGHLRWCVAAGDQEALLELDDRHPSTAVPPPLRRLAAGDARPTLAAWAAGQGWLAHTGAVLLGYGCPEDAAPPAIRAAHLHAGHAVHQASLTAARLGLPARPVGSWQGADLGAALGDPPGRDWVVHGLALGGPRPRTSDPTSTTSEDPPC
ncbi:SagB/ThcOx family dehydrogenase [Streptomyces durbertensis]|uniref:SagB/ThcOx family dehydrogenase n=1 Tax=Streptomyces durbertensis TaxID=2448886 RepID=A0ABR6EIU1_9ACTN|nr:SagB/ThcOx family dehydrogenase [Streptomyces durbertensis]